MHIGGARSSSQEKDAPCSWCQLLTNLVPSVLHLLIWVPLSNSQEATAQASGGLCTVAITFLLQVHLHLNPFPSSVLTFLHCNPDLASSLHSSASHCHPEVAIQSLGMICEVRGHLTSPLFPDSFPPISPNTHLPSAVLDMFWLLECTKMDSTAFIPFHVLFIWARMVTHIPPHHLKILLVMMKKEEGEGKK